MENNMGTHIKFPIEAWMRAYERDKPGNFYEAYKNVDASEEPQFDRDEWEALEAEQVDKLMAEQEK